jgi:hypothetical protein
MGAVITYLSTRLVRSRKRCINTFTLRSVFNSSFFPFEFADSLGEVNADERKDFFTKLNIWVEKLPAYCADFTAERGYGIFNDCIHCSLFRRILTRTKYELLVNYIRSNTSFTLPESRRVCHPTTPIYLFIPIC